MSDVAMEGLARIASSLIHLEFERMLLILDKHLDDLHLLDEEEKAQCIGASKAHPNLLYWVDGCDFPFSNASERWMYKTHKPNVPKQCGIRAQILCDSRWLFFRGMEVAPCGLYNDQAMLKNSDWNRPNKLTQQNEYIGGDKGYASTDWINVMKPFSKKDLADMPNLRLWNQVFNNDRQKIECNFAAVKGIFRIFDNPWRRNRHLFPLALKVALKLLNHYWSLP